MQGHFEITTYTPIARLPIMTPADPAVKDSWGLVINAALPLIEQVAAGIARVDLTGLTTHTLTVANDGPDEARPAMLVLSGAPTGTCTVTIPSVARIGWVANNTSQTVILATSTAVTNLTIPAGVEFFYSTDGTVVGALNISTLSLLNATGGVLIGNGSTYQAVDSVGTNRALLGIDSSGNTNLFAGGILGWRVLNQAGSAALFSIAPTGAAVFAAGLTVGGTLGVSGATTHTGTTALIGTATAAAGVIAIGLDAGGLNVRYAAATYGAGWRNDDTNTFFLLTPAGAPLGAFSNTLRPFFVNNATGAVTIDGSGVGTTFGGPITASAGINTSQVIYTSGSAFFNNSQGIQMKDAGGTYRWFAYTGSDNWTNQFQTGGIGWRVLNQGGSTTLFSVDTGGSGTFTGNVGCLGIFATNGGTIGGVSLGGGTVAASGNITASGSITASGNIGAAGNINAAGGAFTSATISGNTSGITATYSGVVTCNGNQGFTGFGGVVDGSGTHGGNAIAYSVGISLVAANGVFGAGFFANSDGRLKTEIADITAEAGYDWIARGRPRSYIMDGRPQVGFVAQEEVDRGRGAAVVAIPDDRPLFAESDGYAPAGARLARRYEHDIAYLTAALQGALARISALEAQAAPG